MFQAVELNRIIDIELSVLLAYSASVAFLMVVISKQFFSDTNKNSVEGAKSFLNLTGGPFQEHPTINLCVDVC